MAKKNEFKPDKPYSSWLSRLYLTRKQRRTLLKWLLYALVLLVLSVLQDVVLSHLRLFGATTDLVPCGIFMICILEGAQSGSVFALVASLLYLFSGTAPGTYSVALLTFLGIGASIFRQAYLQKGIGAALLCTAAAMLLYQFITFGFGLFLGLTIPARWIGFLTTTVLSLLITPLLYPICLSIGTIGGETWKE